MKGRIYLIDFGLARKYRIPTGEIRPPRKSAGFRGTARYASINSHKSKELGRRDDLWSVFYVLVEFALGTLPWRKMKDKDAIGGLKEKYTTKELVKDLPKEFSLFLESLQKLGYADDPDYNELRSLLLQIYSKEGYSSKQPFDWDISEENKEEEKDKNFPPQL
jgi:tau tubulin kinase